MREGEPPEGFPATEVVVLHDPGADSVIIGWCLGVADDPCLRGMRRETSRSYASLS